MIADKGKLWRCMPLVLLLTLPAVVQAQFNFTTNSDNTLTISGYTGPGGAVIIPSSTNSLPVTGIGISAFLSNTILSSVTIPDSVTNIGGSAFAFCTSLTNVMIGNSVTSIESAAFLECTNLTSVTIPDSVTNLGSAAFFECSRLTSVTIPGSVSRIGNQAFEYCTRLTSVYFQGNAPGVGLEAFGYDNATVYYLPGTIGWSFYFAGLPTVLWNPQVQTSDASFGVRTNQFGFNITGSSNLVIVVEACTNLTHPVWSPLQTNTLTGGAAYFSDPQWTNQAARFYRLRSP